MSGWREGALNQLIAKPLCAYRPGNSLAAEPTALSCLALAWEGRGQAALRAADWLASIQSPDGSVGVMAGQSRPRWVTSLAVLAWHACRAFDDGRYAKNGRRAVAWILSMKGKPAEDPLDFMGHNTDLIAWPWVDGTHSWVEPTALYVLALKVSGCGWHTRVREAVDVLRDRLLDTGGCNYGNTRVFNQDLRPQVLPTALATLALIGEEDLEERTQRSVRYLRGKSLEIPSACSWCWGALALAARDQLPENAGEAFERLLRRARRRQTPPYKYALMLLADPQRSWALRLREDLKAVKAIAGNQAATGASS